MNVQIHNNGCMGVVSTIARCIDPREIALTDSPHASPLTNNADGPDSIDTHHDRLAHVACRGCAGCGSNGGHGRGNDVGGAQRLLLSLFFNAQIQVRALLLI